MGVSVDAAQIVSRWADADNPEWVWVALEVDGGEGDAASAVENAVLATNAAQEHEWLDDAGEPTGAETPIRHGHQIVIRLYSRHEDGRAHWLKEFTRQLDAAGVSGHVGVHREAAQQIGVLSSGRRAASATIALAVNGWDVPHRVAARAPWRAEPDRIPEFIDLASKFIDQVSGPIALHAGATSSIHRSAVDSALRAGLEAEPIDVPNVWLQQFGVVSNRGVTFDMGGRVMLTVEAAEPHLKSEVDAAWAFAVTWASACSWIVLLGRGAAEFNFPRAYRAARGRRLPAYYDKQRDLDGEKLPDAFARQVVTDTHIAAATDLSTWNVSQISEDRFDVTAPHWDQWLTSSLNDAESHQADRIETARRDWGNALMLS